MASNQPKSTLDGLPKQFVLSMRTLFEIMDSGKTGYVKFSDIENRWQDNGTKGLPKGVLDSLRKVTPSNGWLSFERFCAGLKIALLRTKFDHSPKSPDAEKLARTSSNPLDRVSVSSGTSQNLNIISPHQPNSHNLNHHHSTTNTATVRPNNAMSQQRTISLPHLQAENIGLTNEPNLHEQPELLGFTSEWKPNKIKIRESTHINKTGIVTALKNWQQEIINGVQFCETKPLIIGSRNRGSGDGKSTSNENNPKSDINSENNKFGVLPNTHKKISQRRKEPRRHTVASGIDYNMLKRIKQLEQEKDILRLGLEAVESAKEWYHRQLYTVEDRVKYLERSTYVDYSSDAYQERLNFQTARIYEVNQLLKALVDSSEKGFPLHMNLAVRQLPLPSYSQAEKMSAINKLKQQNHLLTKEMSQMGERVSQLESEKSALIRELFQARSQQQKENSEDTTFM